MTLSPKTIKVVIIATIVTLAGIIGFNLFQVFEGTPSKGPTPPVVLKEPKKIGVLHFRQQNEAVSGLKEGLKELGYENVTYEEIENFPVPTMEVDIEQAAKKLIEKKVDLIWGGLEFQAKGALQATKEMKSDIPVLFLSSFHDPVKYGLVKSFKSSGNNATGISINLVEVLQKQLEFLREINPNIKRIGVFTDGFMLPNVSDENLVELKLQAVRLGYAIVEYKTSVPPPEAEKAWYQIVEKIQPGEIDAIIHLPGHFFSTQEAAESKLANRLGIPMIAPLEDLPAGGHFGYSGDMMDTGKQSARLVDKIFRGENPSNIPLEFTRKNILVIYLERAQKAGIKFPDSMISIANIKTEE